MIFCVQIKEAPFLQGNIIGFPQGVFELMLEAVLNRMFNEELNDFLKIVRTSE